MSKAEIKTDPPHALAEALREIAGRLPAFDARFVKIAADSLEFNAKKEWVNSDVLRMAKDLERQADELHDWHDPTGRRRGKLLRSAAGLRVVYARLGEGRGECGEKAPSGRCRRERGHMPPWGHQGDAPDSWASAGPDKPLPFGCMDTGCQLPHVMFGLTRQHLAPKTSG